jgi:PBP1b-binding outer membrane lipoprotein LpoB
VAVAAADVALRRLPLHDPTIMSIRSVTAAVLGLLLVACAGTRDTRVNPDAPDTVTGTGLQSQDIRTMAVDMAAKIKASGVLAPSRDGERASFFIYELRNDSSDSIDKEIILTKLRTELFDAFARQVKIIDRSPQANDLVDAERRMKERGQVSGTNDRKIAGSDFVLKGTIKSRDRQAGKLKSSYILVTFELTDLVTSELMWTGDYDMKTESEKSVINR